MRASIPEADHRRKSEQASRHMLAHPFFVAGEKPRTICTYMPFRSELDITPVMEWCWQQGINVLVPRANRMDRSLHLHWINSYDDLESGAWGIREPKQSLPEWDVSTAIDAIIVPGLAFDLQGGRLGYGGGYYDRFIRSLRRAPWKSPLLIAIAFASQIVDAVPMEGHDLECDVIITERGIMKQ